MRGLLDQVFGRRPVQAPRSAERVWAIGDIHGCDDLLAALLDGIEATEADSATGDKPLTLIFLGDYVDRGPGSRDVLDRLIQLNARTDTFCHFIRGNHDDLMRQFLDDATCGPRWIAVGARATLQSYGIAVLAEVLEPAAWESLRADLVAALPQAHRDFLDALQPSVASGDYFFTHAGARPGRSLADQRDADLMWIRGAFLDSPQPFEKVVVHGHTPIAQPHSDARRIGIDTGAYATGILTAVRLSSGEVTFLQARRDRDEGGTIALCRDVPVTAH